MEVLPPEGEILLSWRRCMERGLSPTNSSPTLILKGEALQSRLAENRPLIGAFQSSVKRISGLVTGNSLFLLTDPEGVLLEETGNKQIQHQGKKSMIETGMFFTEESSGTNAIAIALRLRQPVYLLPEHHYCDFLKKWYCFAAPLCIDKKVVGCLDVSTIEQSMKRELIAIVKLLADRIIEERKEIAEEMQGLNSELELTDNQVVVLQLLARGLTEEAVAKEMCLSLDTVKYHKKKIFWKLDAKNSRDAIAKALKFKLIRIE